MKKLLVLTTLAVTSMVAMGQGAVNFGNRVTAVGIDAPVTYNGVKLDGAAFKAQLYWGTSQSSLAPVGPILDFRTGTAAGYIVSTIVDVGVAGGTAGFVQMVAWEFSKGATWAAAGGASGAVGTGASNIIPITPAAAPATPPNMAGLTAFSLVPVPEPATIALGLLGLGALALRRRK